MTDPILPPQSDDADARPPVLFCQSPKVLCGELMIGTLDGWRCPLCGAVVLAGEVDRAE